jgi:hypothetical protein
VESGAGVKLSSGLLGWHHSGHLSLLLGLGLHEKGEALNFKAAKFDHSVSCLVKNPKTWSKSEKSAQGLFTTPFWCCVWGGMHLFLLFMFVGFAISKASCFSVPIFSHHHAGEIRTRPVSVVSDLDRFAAFLRRPADEGKGLGISTGFMSSRDTQ